VPRNALHVALLALALAPVPARAADSPVIYADDASLAIHAVAADADRPVWTLRPIRLTEEISGETLVAIGSDQPPPCGVEGSTNSTLLKTLGLAEDLLLYKEFVRAKEALDTAQGALRCLTEPAEGSLGARLHFLRGLTAAGLDDPEGADRAFAQALAFRADLPWDERFPAEWRPSFDRALGSVDTHATGLVVFGPGVGDTSRIWVDGQMLDATGNSLELTEGAHLLQFLEPAGTTLEVEVRANRPVAVLVPALLSDQEIVSALDLSTDPLLKALVSHTFPSEQTLFLWTGANTLRIDETFELLPRAEPVSLEDRRRMASRLAIGGGVATGLGIAAGAVGIGIGLSADKDAACEPACQTLEANRAAQGAALQYAGISLIGSGLASIGVSFAIAPKERSK